MIPGQPILGVVGLEESVACKMAEHSASDGVLEAFQELVGEAGGFVEAEAAFWIGRILAPITLDPLEKSIDHAEMNVKVRVQSP